ncbi:general transcription factor 3C polypeptide 6 isoform X2 [Carcharodon carcharias]|uniref:general transcription factor 3C polypeptide 6 isoform X2 n=1 Tax=Carcharodon carcharias TaxID=13397 RepID=UPI001B7DD47E|nr:general transcription factor 3C polypeptide 6 isoform X2 [Carcharodon carcharias]
MASGAMGKVPVPVDGDWEEEEQLVVVELSGIIDPDFLLKCRNECKIVGIDTEQPIMQVDRCVFAGEYEDVLGTCVIFEETTEPGGVEYLKIKENDFTRRAGLICSFLPNRSSSKDDGSGVTSEGALNSLAVQDKELSNASSGSEGETSDRESADLSRDLETFTDEHPGMGCGMTSDADNTIMEIGELSSNEHNGK